MGLKRLFLLPVILLVVTMSGFETNKQMMVHKPRIVPASQEIFNQEEVTPDTNSVVTEIPSLTVQHHIKGRDVLVECIVTGISFRNEEQTNKKIGKLIVWIDAKRHSDVTSAAFIIKGLTPGIHTIKLEMVKLNNERYGLTQDFLVKIPK